jgi:hypothetical protein
MNHSIRHNGSKMVPKIEKHHHSQLSHPADSPGINLCDFGFFGILKGILNDRGFGSNDEVEGGIALAGLTSLSIACSMSSTTG